MGPCRPPARSVPALERLVTASQRSPPVAALKRAKMAADSSPAPGRTAGAAQAAAIKKTVTGPLFMVHPRFIDPPSADLRCEGGTLKNRRQFQQRQTPWR